MQTIFDIQNAPPVPGQAANVKSDTQGHVRGIEASPRQLVTSTLKAGGIAAVLLTVFYLPSEYGVDPTGLGGVLGLTEMGEIKQQLYAEDAADAAAMANTMIIPTELLDRLDSIEEQLKAINAGNGAGRVAPAPVPAPQPMSAPVRPDSAASNTIYGAQIFKAVGHSVPEVILVQATDAAVAEAMGSAAWRDEASYALAPGEGVEVKLAMTQGETASFEWTANGAVVNYDTHGDGGGQNISYEKGRGVGEQSGELTAAFTGNHGWFWRNRTSDPVTITVRTNGEYSEMKLPR